MVGDKMSIIAYTSNKYSGTGSGKCSVSIKPSSYSHEHKVSYNEDVPVGAPGTPLMFKGTSPETISVEINFDATGVIDNNIVLVKTQLDDFKKVCFNYNGNIHEPNYLMVSWGSLVFKCKLTSLKIEYTLFRKDGTALRAKASCSFTQALDASTIAKTANNKSPDLTHLIMVKQGDTLPIICNNVYGDPSYYMEVAKFNNIINFRNLVPGTKLYLPPIK